MRVVPVVAMDGVAPTFTARLAAEVASLFTLADVLEWARRQDPQLQVADIVTQDEYTHDVVVRFDGAHFLVFDAT